MLYIIILYGLFCEIKIGLLCELLRVHSTTFTFNVLETLVSIVAETAICYSSLKRNFFFLLINKAAHYIILRYLLKMDKLTIETYFIVVFLGLTCQRLLLASSGSDILTVMTW